MLSHHLGSLACLGGEVAQNRKDLPDRKGDLKGSPVVTVLRANVIYAGLILGLSAAWPLATAWRNTRGSTIRHALAWAWIAWAAWLWYGWSGGQVAAYAALTLTAATGIAVFGAGGPARSRGTSSSLDCSLCFGYLGPRRWPKALKCR